VIDERSAGTNSFTRCASSSGGLAHACPSTFITFGTTKTLGIDEAGRGAHVGPLVLAAVALTPEQSDRLIADGLRDSKPLSQRRRTALAAMIRASASWAATEASSSRVVDRYVAGGFRGAPTLNVLEQRMATRLIRLAPPCTTIVADGQVLFRPLEDHFPNLRAVNHADDSDPSVMAAAILAKVERDRLLATIDKTSSSLCGFIPRKGYPGRETTAWLARYQAFFGTLPLDARNTWGRSKAP
jgi:ribonuclease HII